MINSKIFSEKVQESFKWLIELGYQFKQIDTNIRFERIMENEAFAIGFSWSEYNKILVNGCIVYKRFNIVESILQKEIGGVLDYTIKLHWQGEIPKELEQVKDKEYFSNAFFIANIFEIDILSTVIKEFYYNEGLNFLDNYKTLMNVLDWLQENEIQRHSDLLVAHNNSMMLRKLIIMKEGHSPEFVNLYDRYSNFLKKKHDERESPYIEMYDNFLKLKDYFNHPSSPFVKYGL